MPDNLPPDVPPVAALMTRFAIAAQHYQTLLEKRLAPKGLTPLQFSVLSHLARRKQPQKITQIASAVNAGQPAISKIVTKFLTTGWITQTADTHDKRIKHVQITQTGATHLFATQKEVMPDIATALQNWGDDDMARFTEDLARFGDLLRTQP